MDEKEILRLAEVGAVKALAACFGCLPSNRTHKQQIPSLGKALEAVRARHCSVLITEESQGTQEAHRKRILTVHTPVDSNGVDVEYTLTWRIWHELAHFLSWDGQVLSRTGSLAAIGLSAARRAIVWEYLAIQWQHDMLYVSDHSPDSVKAYREEMAIRLLAVVYRVVIGGIYTWAGNYFPVQPPNPEKALDMALKLVEAQNALMFLT